MAPVPVHGLGDGLAYADYVDELHAGMEWLRDKGSGLKDALRFSY